MTDKPHLLLSGLVEQARYVYAFAQGGQTDEALEHADAMQNLLDAYRAAVGADREAEDREDARRWRAVEPLIAEALEKNNAFIYTDHLATVAGLDGAE